MSIQVDPIPVDTAITDKLGRITEFFRLRYEQLRGLGQSVPSIGNGISQVGLSASLATVAIVTTTLAGFYLPSYYVRKTVADGVASSLTVTLGWTEHGVPLTATFAALALDTPAANQAALYPIFADANTDITIAIAYTSNTPALMHYNAYARAALLT